MIIGLDGATLSLLKPWADKGLLPNLNEFIKNGCSGVLKSTLPPYTPPAWSSIYTGVNPGKHGIFGFTGLNPDTGRREFMNSLTLGSRKFWQIANDHGLRVGLINLPLTYPPEPLDGYIISGMMTPRNAEEFTYPKSLSEQLGSQVNPYIIDEVSQPESSLLDRLLASLKGRREACLNLLKNDACDLAMMVFVTHDRIQHVFWKYIDEQSDLYDSAEAESMRGKIIECYQFLDEIIGEIVEAAGDDCRKFIISDHGFGDYKGQFLFNNWLAGEGYFSLKSSSGRLLRLGRVLNRSGFAKYIGIHGRRAMADARKKGLEKAIDYNQTTAYALEQGLFLNMSGREEGGIVTKGSEYNRIRDEITAKLKLLRDPATGEKVIDSIIMKEDAYSGSYLDLSPDIIVQFKDYAYSIGESIVRQEIIIDRRNVPLGNHHIDGILFAHGTDIASGRTVEHAEIVDIAPTILYALGLPAPDYFDGKVLTDLFDDDFVKRNPVQVQMEAEDIDRTKESVYTQEEAAEMEEQLRGMGYI